jgi:DNA-binding PadR family transcriptional regulator
MGVREGLLALLEREPAYGYQLKTGFEAATGGVWSLNVGQVYATLDRLERDGLVESNEREGQRSYRITPRGSDELGAWWEAEVGDDPPPRDELVVKVMMAIAQGAERGLDVVTRQRNALLVLLQQRQRASAQRKRSKDGASVADQLMTDALVVRAEADLRWLDLCEERLVVQRRSGTGAGAPSGSTRKRGNRS